MMGPAGPNHGDLANIIAYRLTDHVLKHKLGKVFAADTGFVISRHPDTVRAPDAAFVRTSRLMNAPKRGFFNGPPDLAVEVVSPDDRAAEIRAKAKHWLEAGCLAVWVIDPPSRTLTVHLAEQSPRKLGMKDTLRAGEELPGFVLKIAQLFEPA